MLDVWTRLRGLARPDLASSRQYAAAHREGAKCPRRCTRDDIVPLGLAHVDEHPVAEDPGVVDEDVQVAEGVDGRVDQLLGPLPVGDVVAVRHRLATPGRDLGDDFVGRAVVRAGAVVGAATVVDDDLGSFGGEQKGVLATDAAPGSRDDRDASLECSHEPRTVVARTGPERSCA